MEKKKFEKLDYIRILVVLAFIAATVYSSIKNVLFIKNYTATVSPAVSPTVADLQKFIATSDDAKYDEFVKNHNSFFNIEDVHFPMGRKDPFVALVDASKNTDDTILTKFTLDLRNAVRDYYSQHGTYPEVMAESGDTPEGGTPIMVGTGEVDLALLQIETKDEKLSKYTFMLDKTVKPVNIRGFVKDKDVKEEVVIKTADITKFKLLNIENTRVPKATFIYENNTIIMTLGEQYLNIRFSKLDSTQGWVILEDNSVTPVKTRKLSRS